MTDKPEYIDPNIEGAMEALDELEKECVDQGIDHWMNKELSVIHKALKQMNWNTSQEKNKRIKAEDMVKALQQQNAELKIKLERLGVDCE